MSADEVNSSRVPSLPGAPAPDPLVNFPRPIRPAYATEQANAEAVLAEGNLEVTWEEGAASGPGRICLAWLPFPRITFALRSAVCPITVMKPESARVRIPAHGVDCACLLSRVRYHQGGADLEGSLPEPAEVGAGSELSRVLFHLPNFHPYRGDFLSTEAGACWRGRLSLAAGEWALTIDAVQHLGGSQGLLGDIQARAGFGITHVGQLKRADDRTFAKAEAERVLEALGLFFSFALGRWTAPLLPVGYDAAGAITWQRWGAADIAPWRDCYSWFPITAAGDIGAALHGFLARWQHHDWNDVVRVAVRWYVEGNAEPVSLESSLLLAQAALESLAYAVLVGERRVLSEDTFARQSIPAFERFRLLVDWAGIPLAIPQSLADLAALGRAENWQDGPQALTELRNAVTHPGRRTRERLARTPPGAKREAWLLSLWYLELLLLRLFGYSGSYADRLCGGVPAPVPWAAAIPPP